MLDQLPMPPFMPPVYPAMYPPPMIGPGGRPMAPPVPWMHDVCIALFTSCSHVVFSRWWKFFLSFLMLIDFLHTR